MIYQENKWQKLKVITNFIAKNEDYWKALIIKHLDISRAPLYRWNDKVFKQENNNSKYDHCSYKDFLFCEELIEFKKTRKGKLYGYRRIILAIKQWLLDKSDHANFNFSSRQMRKLMNDHNLKTLKRSSNKN